MADFYSSRGRIAYAALLTASSTEQEILIFLHGLPTAKELFTPVLLYMSPPVYPHYREPVFRLADTYP